MRKSMYIFMVLIWINFMVISFNGLAQAGPPLKPGNPGVPGLLAKIAELEKTVADQKATIQALQKQVTELQALLDAMQNYVPVVKTWKTFSYIPGDDGDLQKGIPWPDPRFTDNGDGTVKDNLTGLIWTKNANLYGYTYYYSEALTFCSSCDEGGYTDWRLPNVRELQSLLDYGALERPLLPAGHPFTGPVGAGDQWYYWSSTSQGVTSAYCISFENGFMWSMSAGQVWCVRGGQ